MSLTLSGSDPDDFDGSTVETFLGTDTQSASSIDDRLEISVEPRKPLEKDIPVTQTFTAVDCDDIEVVLYFMMMVS